MIWAILIISLSVSSILLLLVVGKGKIQAHRSRQHPRKPRNETNRRGRRG